MERIQLSTDEVDGVAVARLEGELDKLGIEKARSRLDPLAGGGKLVVDLDRVTFIDSAGLHALFGLARLASSRGRSSRTRGRRLEPDRPGHPARSPLRGDAGVADRRGGGRRPHGLSLAPRTTGRRQPDERRSHLPPRGVTKGSKRGRQYEHIKESLEDRGEPRAEEIAARTVNKERARLGEARESSRLSRTDISSGRRGGIRANRKVLAAGRRISFTRRPRTSASGPLEDDEGTAAARRHTQAKLSAGEDAARWCARRRAAL